MMLTDVQESGPIQSSNSYQLMSKTMKYAFKAGLKEKINLFSFHIHIVGDQLHVYMRDGTQLSV